MSRLAAVAQLARASACHAEGRGFESLQPLRKAPLRRGFFLRSSDVPPPATRLGITIGHHSATATCGIKASTPRATGAAHGTMKRSCIHPAPSRLIRAAYRIAFGRDSAVETGPLIASAQFLFSSDSHLIAWRLDLPPLLAVERGRCEGTSLASMDAGETGHGGPNPSCPGGLVSRELIAIAQRLVAQIDPSPPTLLPERACQGRRCRWRRRSRPSQRARPRARVGRVALA